MCHLILKSKVEFTLCLRLIVFYRSNVVVTFFSILSTTLSVMSGWLSGASKWQRLGTFALGPTCCYQASGARVSIYQILNVTRLQLYDISLIFKALQIKSSPLQAVLNWWDTTFISQNLLQFQSDLKAQHQLQLLPGGKQIQTCILKLQHNNENQCIGSQKWTSK